ncbi:hypothetical protein EV715DRAFT_265808 [Schizophyllum commune]
MGSVLSGFHLALDVLQACAFQDLSVVARVTITSLTTFLTITLCMYFLEPSRILHLCNALREEARGYASAIAESNMELGGLESSVIDARFKDDCTKARNRLAKLLTELANLETAFLDRPLEDRFIQKIKVFSHALAALRLLHGLRTISQDLRILVYRHRRLLDAVSVAPETSTDEAPVIGRERGPEAECESRNQPDS